MTTESSELAWIAGLFDGEGCVRLHVNREKPASRRFRIGLIVLLGMVHKPTVERLMELAGVGRIYKKRGVGGLRDQFYWRVNSSSAVPFLLSIRPYSVTKADQIDAALSAQAKIERTSRGRLPRLPEDVAALRHMAEELSAAKRVAYH